MTITKDIIKKKYFLKQLIVLKNIVLKSATVQSNTIFDYYIKIENTITLYLETQHNKLIENNKKLLELKDNEINKIKNLTYKEAATIGSIYILSTDKPNITKC